jgi:hypothetical protein
VSCCFAKVVTQPSSGKHSTTSRRRCIPLVLVFDGELGRDTPAVSLFTERMWRRVVRAPAVMQEHVELVDRAVIVFVFVNGTCESSNPSVVERGAVGCPSSGTPRKVVEPAPPMVGYKRVSWNLATLRRIS